MPVDNNELEKIKEKFKEKLTQKNIEANSMSALNTTQNEPNQASQPSSLFQHAKSEQHIKNNNGVDKMPEDEEEGDEGDGRSEGEKETEKKHHGNDDETPSSGL